MTLARNYDAATEPRGILRHVLPLYGYPAMVWRHRYLVQNFFRRDLMARFHGSFLGAWWMLVQPMFLFVVYYLVFGLLFGNWKWGMAPDPKFALWLFSGVIIFNSLLEATSSCCAIIVNNANLVKKVAFPSEVLPVHVAMVSLVLYGVGATVLVVAGSLLGELSFSWISLALPLVLAVQFVMTIGIGLLLANADVFARDVAQMWRIFGMAWMFLSPVFWFPSMLVNKFEEHPIVPELFFHLNPSFSLIQAHRIVLGGTGPEMGDFWTHLGTAAIWAAVFFVIGYSTFTANKHKHADLI